MDKVKTVEQALNRGIQFIAFNDDPEVMTLKTISESISVITLSETLGISTRVIAKSVIALRKYQRALLGQRA